MQKTYFENYDVTNPESIEAYAKKLIGKTFRQISREDTSPISDLKGLETYDASHENRKQKGGLGVLIEERYFHYKANSISDADFPEAGVELKVSPFKVNKNGTLAAKERLIITMIDYFSVVNERFYESHFWKKGRLILLIYYLYQKELERLDYTIKYADLFTPPIDDIRIIKQDYEIIVEKIKAGKAHELSESDTMYLGAASKASTSKDRTKQPFNLELAKPRAFAYKNSYMTYVLNHYIVPGKVTYEAIIKEKTNLTFEDYVVKKIQAYQNYSFEDLCEIFEVNSKSNAKNLVSTLTFRILGVKGNHAEEFEKANIVIKSIRLTNRNTIKENMSFPRFKFKEIVNEEWESSCIGRYFEETKFLFVVFKFDAEGVLRLKGCQFWNMPYADLNEEVKSVWEKTRNILKEGIVISNEGKRTKNNLPKASENRVCHVRPHAKNSKDVDELPNGQLYPKQCFWLNNKYILMQLKESFFQ
ncbi:Sau3AI family type II restriction endonuclease [Emergencia sp.]|uniref:Sau3AI family type II restriction endonuclease n=1 Tax=Emergencia sp. TaxID=1926557 RepID=UPI003AF0CD56